MVGVFYIALAGAPTLWFAALCVLLAHFGGAILWVFSTVLLQLEVPDRFRGRVFAAELALVTLLSSVSSYWTGYQLDRAGWSPRRLAFALGVMFCVPGVLWLIVQARWKETAVTSVTPDSGQLATARRGEFEVESLKVDERRARRTSNVFVCQPFLSVSIALCTSCFASSSCSSTSAMSIFGLPGNRSLRQ